MRISRSASLLKGRARSERRRTGTACGRRRTGCARRCSTSSRRGSPARVPRRLCGHRRGRHRGAEPRRGPRDVRRARSARRQLIETNLSGARCRTAMLLSARDLRTFPRVLRTRLRRHLSRSAVRMREIDAGARHGSAARAQDGRCWSSSTPNGTRLRRPYADLVSDARCSCRATARCRFTRDCRSRITIRERRTANHENDDDVVAIYPGSFDPLTNGHVDIIQRGSRLFDRIVVGDPAQSREVAALHRARARRASPARCSASGPMSKWTPSTACSSTMLAVSGASVIVRGLRAISDFEYEMQMALMNRRLNPGGRDGVHDAGRTVHLRQLAAGQGSRRARRLGARARAGHRRGAAAREEARAAKP